MSPQIKLLILVVLLPIISCQYVFPRAKEGGSCPPPTPVQICSPDCLTDTDCEGTNKCCPTQCGGAVCTLPVTETTIGTKPGYCPVNPTGPWVCTDRCTTDSDCRRNSKCCRNRCGALACITPTQYFGEQ